MSQRLHQREKAICPVRVIFLQLQALVAFIFLTFTFFTGGLGRFCSPQASLTNFFRAFHSASAFSLISFRRNNDVPRCTILFNAPFSPILHDAARCRMFHDARCSTMHDALRCAMLHDARCSTMRLQCDARCSAICVDTMRDTLR